MPELIRLLAGRCACGTCRTETAARIALGKLLQQAAVGRQPESNVTVATLLDEYAAIAEWELSTREANEGYIRRTIKPRARAPPGPQGARPHPGGLALVCSGLRVPGRDISPGVPDARQSRRVRPRRTRPGHVRRVVSRGPPCTGSREGPPGRTQWVPVSVCTLADGLAEGWRSRGGPGQVPPPVLMTCGNGSGGTALRGHSLIISSPGGQEARWKLSTRVTDALAEEGGLR
jgi:hypothetical protein